jgi:Sortase domain
MSYGRATAWAACVAVAVTGVVLIASARRVPPSLPVVASSVAPPVSRQVASPVTSPATRVAPTQVIIPAIGVNAAIVPVATDSVGALEVPPLTEENVTGWWDGGYAPGQDGPAVIVGHVDSAVAGPLVFWDLGRMVPGQTIEIEPGNLWFVVTGTQEISKSAFPTQQVYGPTAVPTLRLISCGGAFDSATGHYVDDIVVYAQLASTP